MHVSAKAGIIGISILIFINVQSNIIIFKYINMVNIMYFYVL